MFNPLHNVEEIAVKVTKTVLAEMLPAIIDPMIERLDKIITLLENSVYTIDPAMREDIS
jgi:hypothetical protein